MSAPPNDLDILRGHVRTFLRDFPANNNTIAGEESSNHEIDFAILMALDDFNLATVPLIGVFDLASFPSLSLLVQGATIWVLRSAGILSSRNFLNFNSGGISAVIADRTAAYQAWINQLMADYETKKASVKMFMNVRQGYGSVVTPYSGLAYYRGGYSPLLQEVFIGFRGFY